MEHRTPSQFRVDLILRHRISKRPVLVEFKALPLTRDNIGQVIEYRAQCISEMIGDTSVLSRVFNSYLSSPILVLVVPRCSQDARVACNLAGIDVFEYEASLKWLRKPAEQTELAAMAKSLNRSALPVTMDRDEKIQEINKTILSVMTRLGVPDGYVEYKVPKGVYYWNLANFFINKWLFADLSVSIGIYEDIFRKKYDKVAIDYYSEDQERLSLFRQQLVKGKLLTKVLAVRYFEAYNEYAITFYEDKKAFIENESVLEKYVKPYLRIMRTEIDESTI